MDSTKPIELWITYLVPAGCCLDMESYRLDGGPRQSERERLIAAWNGSPSVRFGVVVAALCSAVLALVPPAPPTSWLGLLRTLLFASVMSGLVSILTGCLRISNRETATASPRPKHGIARALNKYGSRLRSLSSLGYERRLLPARRQQTTAPPTGYVASTEGSGPWSTGQRFILALSWAIPPLVLLVGFGPLAYSRWGLDVAMPFGLVTVVGVLLATTALHELLHALVARLYGAGIAAGVKLPGIAYIRPTEARLSRRGRLLITLAPTIVITAAAISVIATAGPWWTFAAVFALLVNTLGCGDDLRRAWRLLERPAETLWVTSSGGTVAYRPENQGNSRSRLNHLENRVVAFIDRLTI